MQWNRAAALCMSGLVLIAQGNTAGGKLRVSRVLKISSENLFNQQITVQVILNCCEQCVASQLSRGLLALEDAFLRCCDRVGRPAACHSTYTLSHLAIISWCGLHKKVALVLKAFLACSREGTGFSLKPERGSQSCWCHVARDPAVVCESEPLPMRKIC